MRCVLLIADCQPAELPVQQDSTAEKIDKGENAHKTRDISPQTNLQRPIANNVSPAKLAKLSVKARQKQMIPLSPVMKVRLLLKGADLL